MWRPRERLLQQHSGKLWMCKIFQEYTIYIYILYRSASLHIVYYVYIFSINRSPRTMRNVKSSNSFRTGSWSPHCAKNCSKKCELFSCSTWRHWPYLGCIYLDLSIDGKYASDCETFMIRNPFFMKGTPPHVPVLCPCPNSVARM